MDLLIKCLDREISNTLKNEIEIKLQTACKIYSRSIHCEVTLFKEKDDKQKNYCIEPGFQYPIQFCLQKKEKAVLKML